MDHERRVIVEALDLPLLFTKTFQPPVGVGVVLPIDRRPHIEALFRHDTAEDFPAPQMSSKGEDSLPFLQSTQQRPIVPKFNELAVIVRTQRAGFEELDSSHADVAEQFSDNAVFLLQGKRLIRVHEVKVVVGLPSVSGVQAVQHLARKKPRRPDHPPGEAGQQGPQRNSEARFKQKKNLLPKRFQGLQRSSGWLLHLG